MESYEMQGNCVIRWAKASEWAPAMKMIWKTFLKFEGKDYSEEGIQKFYEFISDDDLYVSFLRGKYQLLVAVDRGNVVGAGSVRNGNFLSLLFVDESYHRQGLGSAIVGKLCDYLKNEAGEKYVVVHSSPYAVEFYRKQGFRAVKPEMVYSGIRVTPMEKLL